MQCEMCGKEAELKKTKVEGAVLKLCKDCQTAGEVIESSGSNSSSGRKKKKSKSRPKEQKKILVRDYSEKVKEARESNDWTIEDLADRINEKESVIHRIESGKLKPDKELAKELNSALGVKLYKNSSKLDYEVHDSKKSSSSGATIGDVAEVKKEG
ncbi:MAG: multiprotein bridging factor aMBF1 [Candidatus Nanohaloarchaeota archaeon QJJ-9]|nr:multiprotein bridging factor aMBF1 [Candidatus Nanohaloarchaeota archaeon QJJ-9]